MTVEDNRLNEWILKLNNKKVKIEKHFEPTRDCIAPERTYSAAVPLGKTLDLEDL